MDCCAPEIKTGEQNQTSVTAKKTVSIGTPFTKTAKKVMLLGAGELGKEVAIELQRFGVEVIAVDRYEHAPAMQVAHRSHVIPMLDQAKLNVLIACEQPDIIVPEIEAIATNVLAEHEKKGATVIPTAHATQLTMNREGIRRLAAENLKIKTSNYRFAQTKEEYLIAIHEIGLPCVVKPIMSSSGKGQSTIQSEKDIDRAWYYAQEGGRAHGEKVIIEGFVDFDYEITLLTVRHAGGTSFCDPIGHIQIDGDYRESWQPHPMSETSLRTAQDIAKHVTDELGGYGIFGVELFVKGDEVIFSEVSPRPHDTGMVTLVSQDLSEFALHARAILGLPIPTIEPAQPSASCALLVNGKSDRVTFENLDEALKEPHTQLRLFGKPCVDGQRRMGVGLAFGTSVDEARKKARNVVESVTVIL